MRKDELNYRVQTDVHRMICAKDVVVAWINSFNNMNCCPECNEVVVLLEKVLKVLPK